MESSEFSSLLQENIVKKNTILVSNLGRIPFAYSFLFPPIGEIIYSRNFVLHFEKLFHIRDTMYPFPSFYQDEDKYLSYENFPVLCRDASAILLPPREQGKPQKSYICKQVFDCCRNCNHVFYTCLQMSYTTYGFCMRGAYKCMCDCIDNRSFQELPYKSTPSPR